MSTLSATVNNVSYPVHIASGYSLADVLEMRSVLTFTIIDSPGTATFTRGMPVVFSDSVTGTTYSGYVQSDTPAKLSPDPTITTILHTLTCMDHQYDVDKVANENPYSGGWHAGDIATDMAVNNKLAAEGILIAAALRHETTTADFSTGTLSGTVASTAIPANDGDLELTKAGSAVTITESTTSDFASGTLTNVVASNNSLSPSTVSAIKFQATLPAANTSANFNLFFWQGAQALGTNDTWNYDIWIASSSPQIMAAAYFLFTDGTISGGMTDNNGRDARSTADASLYAKDQWYTRNISTSTWNGKTIQAVVFKFGGTSQGTYTAYIKNAYLTSGPVIFATNATATQLNPPVPWTYVSYDGSSFVANVVQAMNPANSTRISPAHSIDAVKLLNASTLAWIAQTPSSSVFTLSVSYDGGSSYTTCTNNTALPALPAGSNIAGASLVLKEAFTVGTDPTALPSLSSVNISLTSAPNATKSDIVQNYITQADWNTGTYTYLSASSGGDLSLGTMSRDWNDNLITNQTSFFPDGNTTQAATGGAYTMTCTTTGGASTGFGTSRLDFVGLRLLNFTLDIDMKFSLAAGDVGVSFRDTSWQTTVNNTFAYLVTFTSTAMTLFAGSNSSNDAITQLATASHSMSAGTYYHLKVVVNGLRFQCYWNNEGTPSIDFTDATYLYQQPGGVGLRTFNHTSSTTLTNSWDNLQITPAPSGTWVSSAISLSSLTTCGSSAIYWTQLNAANPQVAYVVVSTSIDGGSTYQTCTNNGAIPGLTPGTNVVGKTLITKVFMASTDPMDVEPIVRQLVWRVLGAFPTITGTRTTAPLGIDNATRANQSGWGTAQDGQAWSKTGTGTDAISSNTATISNTTGDVDEQIGSKTATDQEATDQIELSASTMTGGIKLRYVSATKYYKLKLTTTGLSIIKNTGAGESTLATTAGTYLTNTFYYLRFRVTGDGPVSLFGKAWLGDGTLIEPGVSAGVFNTSNPQWTVSTTD